MKKRIFCMILSLCLVVGLLPVTGLAVGWSGLKAGDLGFHYGNGNFLKITMPTKAGNYTYGTAAGETAAETAADVSVLPESGWQWAVTKESSGFRMILNDFNITYSSATDGLMFYCALILELRGSNSITSTTTTSASVISGNNAPLTILGQGSLLVDADQSYGILAYSSTLTVLGGTLTVASNNGAMRTSPKLDRGMKLKVSSNKDGSNAKEHTGSVSSYKWVQIYWEAQGDYNIGVSQSSQYKFPMKIKGYTEAPDPLTVEIFSLGANATGDLTVALSGENADCFTLSKTTIASIASRDSESFTVQPKLGLDVGVYKATVTISGSNVTAKSFVVALDVRSEMPVEIGSNKIRSVNDLKKVATATGAFTVTEADGIVTIKLLHDVKGQLFFDYKDAYIIIDANGKLFDGGETAQPITLEHNNNITVELTGNGIYMPGEDSTIFVGYESALIIRSATIEGVVNKYGSDSVVKFALEDGAKSYTVKKNGADLFSDPYLCAEMSLSSSTGRNDVLVVETSDVVVYNVVFKNWDGKVLSSKHYNPGDKVTVPSNPSRSRDETYEYIFTGWDKPVEETCTASVVYTAVFEQKYREYTVTFYNYDGATLSKNTYHYGDKIVIPADPTYADKTYTYTFTGWNSEIATTCTGTKSYRAQYSKEYIDYTVTFKDADGTVLSTKTYHYGDKVTAPAAPTKAADKTYTYSFKGWDKEVVACAGDATYTATYDATYIDYTVTFKDADGTVLSTKTYHYGDKVTAPAAPAKPDYTFVGWDKEIADCAGDAEYTAVFTKNGIPGDMNGNETLDTNDAVYLLLRIMFGAEDYPIAGDLNLDLNGDETVDTNDAVYLLLHVMFGAEDYPL